MDCIKKKRIYPLFKEINIALKFVTKSFAPAIKFLNTYYGGKSMNQDPLIKKYALITVLVASFTTPFMGSAVNLAIPSIGREFNSSALLLSWVVSSYLLSSAAFLLPFGRLADLVGRKKVFIIGAFL